MLLNKIYYLIVIICKSRIFNLKKKNNNQLKNYKNLLKRSLKYVRLMMILEK